MKSVLIKFWMGAWRISLAISAAFVVLYGAMLLHAAFPNALILIFVASLFCFGAYTIGSVIQQDREFKRKLDEIDRQWQEDMKTINQKVNNDSKV